MKDILVMQDKDKKINKRILVKSKKRKMAISRYSLKLESNNFKIYECLAFHFYSCAIQKAQKTYVITNLDDVVLYAHPNKYIIPTKLNNKEILKETTIKPQFNKKQNEEFDHLVLFLKNLEQFKTEENCK